MTRKKVALVGGGQIGGALAQIIAIRRLADVVLFDAVPNMPQGKALDIQHSSGIEGFDLLVEGSNDWKDVEGADVVVVTAGKPRKPGMTREDLLAVNAAIVSQVAREVGRHAPDSVAIVLTNPLDAMAELFRRESGMPAARVVGQSGVLDSTRFASLLARELEVSVRDVNAMVLGGHGASMLPIVRLANVGGLPVMDLLERKFGGPEAARERIEKIIHRTRFSGDEIVSLLGNGSAFIAPASATAAMVEAVLLDQKRVLPACARLAGEFGVDGLYVGVPCVLGAGGIEKVLEFDLLPDERVAFDHSVDVVRKLVAELDALGGAS